MILYYITHVYNTRAFIWVKHDAGRSIRNRFRDTVAYKTDFSRMRPNDLLVFTYA